MKKQVYLIGIGTGRTEMMTVEAQRAIRECTCLIGAARMLSSLGELAQGKQQRTLIASEDILEFLNSEEAPEKNAVILSGDVGFYSGGKKLYELLAPEDFEVTAVCGISSFVYFCSRLKIPWDSVVVQSAHGRTARVVNAVMRNPRVFFLTGGEGGRVDQICSLLTEKGLGQVLVHVGERLSYPEERILSAAAEELSQQEFDPLSVMLVEHSAAYRLQTRAHGLSDDEFLRGSVPMTKREVRSAALSTLSPRESDICWDVGAGTGSVSIEMALLSNQGCVYAVERSSEALELIAANREKFGVYNLEIVSGSAPDALRDLPAPDRVFIGGSGKRMEDILRLALSKNPSVTVVITAIALETAAEALHLLDDLHFTEVDAVSISVARAKKAGSYHMMMGQNPVYIISGTGDGTPLVSGEIG